MTVVETTTQQQAVEQSSDSQTLGEQQAHRIVYDSQGRPCVVDASGFEVIGVVSTNSQGNLQQTGGCLLEGNATSMQSEGNLVHLGESQHYAQTMQSQSPEAVFVTGDTSDLDQRIQQLPMHNSTSSNANVFLDESQAVSAPFEAVQPAQATVLDLASGIV